MKLLAEWLSHASYDRPTQERLIGPLTQIAVAWIQGSHESFSERERFAVGIQAGPTGLYHAGHDVYLLTCAAFERGDPAPADVMIYAGPRECIEQQMTKMKVEASKTKLTENGASGLN
jgi:hypothetical protein